MYTYILHTSKQDGVTPLWIASQFGHADVIRALIRHKATVDKVDKVTAQVMSPPAKSSPAAKQFNCRCECWSPFFAVDVHKFGMCQKGISLGLVRAYF